MTAQPFTSDLLASTDARKWAEALCAVAADKGVENPPGVFDPEWLTTWFAAAMYAQEHSSKVLGDFRPPLEEAKRVAYMSPDLAGSPDARSVPYLLSGILWALIAAREESA